jgi:Asp/Glu/hydantoin racemase
MSAAPRIALIHALRESQAPSWAAFDADWPAARTFNLLDDSLSADFAAIGALTPRMTERFLTLGRYAAGTDPDGQRTAAILFTCSAFGAAIDAVKRDLPIPVLRPNEAAFEAALDIGGRIALMTTFPKSLPPLVAELEQMAAERGARPEILTTVAEGGLEALKAGDAFAHDEIAAATAAALPPVDVLVLCQFSLARAAAAIAPVAGRTVLTTPASAVAKLRRLVG